IGFRQIVAGRQPGLEEQAWPGTLRDDLAGDLHPDVAGAARHIDPVVRVTGVDKDLVILLVPGVHLVPVESDVVPERLEAWPRIRAGPGCLLRAPLPCDDIEAGGPGRRRPGRARRPHVLARAV